MTIYNQVNNISDDYTFVLNTDELFYTKEEMPCGVFEYNVSNQTWTETRKTSNAFDTKYEDAKNFVKTYYQSILDIINPETKYSDLLTEVGAGNGLFIGIQMDSIKGFPQLNDNQYFITIISPSLKMCIPVKSFVLYSNTRIVENNDEELNDLEYLSAKQCLNLIYNAISKVEILQIVDELPTQPSDIKTNCVYLLYEENNQSQDEIDDGLNFHFTLWVYSTTDEEFKQIDRLTFDIKNYALKNHTHGLISNDGKIGNAAGVPLITGVFGLITPGRFGSSSSTTATDFVSCADTRLSDSRTPTAHASTAITYGVGTETKYGHNKVINNLTTSSHQNGTSLSAYQGKVLSDAISEKENSSNKTTSLSSSSTDTQYPSAKCVYDAINDIPSTKFFIADNVSRVGPSEYTQGAFAEMWEIRCNDLTDSDLEDGFFISFDKPYASSYSSLPVMLTFVSTNMTNNYTTTFCGWQYESNYEEIISGYVLNKRISFGMTYVDYQFILLHGQLSSEFNNKEDISNKTTSLSSSSTDTQYPSAKCVYDAISNIEQTGASNVAASNHSHGDINNDGTLTSSTVTFSTSDVPLVADASASGKIQKGYIPSVYVKDNRAYANIGSSSGDTQYKINNDINSTFAEKEDTSNKTTILSASSTDTQYPSAKCVYDSINTATNGVRVDVVDNLTTDNGTKALSAKQGKILSDTKASAIHSHAISDVTDLDIALNDKEDVLVSGYNIKTINNESVLGSGNLTIQNENNYYLYMDGDELVFLAAEEEQITTTVQVIWDDNDNSNGLRPAQVICTLSNGETFTLSDSNNWTATVCKPKYINGQEALYTWSESSILGYTATKNTSNNVTIFTNTYNRPQPPSPSTPPSTPE